MRELGKMYSVCKAAHGAVNSAAPSQVYPHLIPNPMYVDSKMKSSGLFSEVLVNFIIL